MKILRGDMRERVPELPADSVDAIVTDPPYGLKFMGKDWDHGVPGPEFWRLLLRVAKPGAHLLAFGGTRTFHRLWCAVEDAGWEVRDTLMWLHGEGFPKSSNQEGDWQGWGTALKPAFEPILMARKPLVGTVAANLGSYGVGALNIDACRIPATDKTPAPVGDYGGSMVGPIGHSGRRNGAADALGRWPANVLHDGSPDVVAAFPNRAGCQGPESDAVSDGKIFGRRIQGPIYADVGSAARFFWCPKASKADRNAGLDGMPRKAVNWSSGDQAPGTFQSPNTDRENENFHPTVKPTELMQYLIRLVTPRGGLVLDPFAGSGSTGKAAALEGADFIGIEIDGQYIDIARKRIMSVAPLFLDVQVA